MIAKCLQIATTKDETHLKYSLFLNGILIYIWIKFIHPIKPIPLTIDSLKQKQKQKQK